MEKLIFDKTGALIKNMTFEHDNSIECGVNIKVIGVGGGGNNAVNRMIATNIRGVEFVSVNTDCQALRKSDAPSQLVIGKKITKGFGAGANPQIGARAAEEAIDDIRAMLGGADMVFITSCMGGGTGTGAAPVIARVARELDILSVGIVTKPFPFEGRKRMEQAEAGISELSQYVDSLIVIPNERLKVLSSAKITLFNAFSLADDVLCHGVQSISDLINYTGLINLDFADITSVMANAGYAHMGVGEATGKDMAEQAAKEAISSPLLETSIKGAKGILMNITVSPNVALDDATLASTIISQEAHENANIIWGIRVDPELEDGMKITIIATGFEKNLKNQCVESHDEVHEKISKDLLKKEKTQRNISLIEDGEKSNKKSSKLEQVSSKDPLSQTVKFQTSKSPSPKDEEDDDDWIIFKRK